MKRQYCLLFVIALFSCLTACVSSGPKPNLEKAAEFNAQLGAGYLAQGQVERAKEKLEKALDQNSNSALANAAYGLLQNQLGDNKKADKHLKKALRIEPENPEYNNNYGTFLCGVGRLQEAEERFNKALRDPLYPTKEFAWTNLGICALKIPDEVKAEVYFRKALDLNPYFGSALMQMAHLYERKRNPRVAYGYVQKYFEKLPETPDSLATAIRLTKQLGDRNAEGKYTIKLRNRFPDSEAARNINK
ncbi:MAG: type IV pilus biogenesis/stability protein PilW [Gammaproteobacteria bacterium]|nr:type IV pilus biogenesis/stability protein PilW [Gammaproteobacteria bacterium]